jgi:hypothetical protein
MLETIENPVKDRYDFANGWRIVVHKATSDEVLFQMWPPNVEQQGFMENLGRMAREDFLEVVAQSIT